MKVTQVKIAEKAKVAQSTVSRVLGGHATDIAPETRHAVLKAAKSLGYSPTVEKTGNIGFIVGGSDVSDFVADPYTHRFFKGVQDYTKEKDYDFFMRSLPENEDLPGVLRKQKVDGLVVSIPLDERRVERISSIVPVVSLNYELKGGNVDSVMPDNRSGIKKVVNYLHRKGHRNIAVFALKPYSMHFTERYSGYLEAIREIGLPEREDYVRFPYRQEGTMEEVEELAKEALMFWMGLKQAPTAVVALNDIFAFGLLKAAHDLGIDIPYDLSITGFDDREACKFSHPALTSINQPMEEMARTACQFLFERIEVPDRPAKKACLDVDLVVRGSSGPVPTRQCSGITV